MAAAHPTPDPAGTLPLPFFLPLTRHARQRVRQRAYRERDLELIVRYGRPLQSGDGHLLLRKDVERLRRQAKHLLDRLDHLAGSAVIQSRDGAVLSVYRPVKAKRRRMVREVA